MNAWQSRVAGVAQLLAHHETAVAPHRYPTRCSSLRGPRGL